MLRCARMIVNLFLLFFLSSALYCSTPTPNSRPKEDNDLSNLFTGEDREFLVFRYKKLKKFYSENFEFFYTTALSLCHDEFEKLLSRDDYYISVRGEMFNSIQMGEIKVVFDFLIDSLIDSKKEKLTSKYTETHIYNTKKLFKAYLPQTFYGLLYAKGKKASDAYSFFGRTFSFELERFSPQESRMYKEELHEYKNSEDDHENKRLEIIFQFIENNFSNIWKKCIDYYQEQKINEVSFEKIFKIKSDSVLMHHMRLNDMIKQKLESQLNIEKQKQELNFSISQFFETQGIKFLCETFDSFVYSKDLQISFGKYVIDFSDAEKNSNHTLSKQFPFLSKRLFHPYFTPFEILTLSSFLIKKFVQPSTAKKFLNNSFGSNFTKKQGVRYLEEYLLPHTGKLFIGAAMLHGLSGKIRSVKKELNKLEKI